MRMMFATVMMALFLGACGGGSTSGGSGGGGVGGVDALYTGNTHQATITASNAKAVSVDAIEGYNGISTATDVSTGGSVAKPAGNYQALLYLPAVTRLLEQELVGAVSKTSAKTVADKVSGSLRGYSGSLSYTADVNRTTGAISGSTTCSDYQSQAGDPKISGTMTYSGTVNTTTGDTISMDASFTNLVYSSSTQSFSFNGSTSVKHSGSTTTVTVSMVRINLAANTTYWFKDFSVTDDGTTGTVTGAYYDHVHGYVTISTELPLGVSSTSARPTSGRILFLGSNGTKARLTFNATGYVLEVDAAGNNVFVTVP